ncbi:MAG: UvrD-helicase domain-containing protein [Acidobacteriaceae bacterium]|nr:UvrD-helicase domain-containing protein [Acidobacteriaceae bacterium]MBV9781175.1 UvrD-helicase domain-containing protein [Acidobacteriaceae bacterium]
MDFLAGLNPQQREAVAHVEGPLLLLAGAGSGKTRVITHRIAHLIEAQHVPGPAVLAVTFTNKAADEMRQRVATLLGGSDPANRPVVSTFHSFCVRTLRRDGDSLAAVRQGFTKRFTIYDDDDQLALLKSVYKRVGLDEKFMQYRAMQSRISHSKSHNQTPEDWYKAATDPKLTRLATIYEQYEEELRKANALDFDDLLLESVRLLRNDDATRQLYNRRYEFVMIDEYQDTNRSQYELMRLLTETRHNVCVVGDEDQSIYGWRGADIRNILDFERDYADAVIIRLEQNYRSTKNILEAASALVANNKERKGKWLWTNSETGARIGYYEAPEGENEALFIADTIEKLLSRNPGERVAVLYRTNSQSRQIEEALRRYGRKYLVVGGFSFYQRAEVKDLLAYLKVLLSPHDSISLLRIINTPARGIGRGTIEQVEQYALEHGTGLWNALPKMLEANLFSSRAEAAIKSFLTLASHLAEILQTAPLDEVLREILEKSGYQAMLEGDSSPESESRLGNLEELVNAAAEAVERGESATEFLDHAALVSESDALDEHAAVSLLTIHNAKGLEFPNVFIAGLEEGIFPHSRSLNSEAAMEEERRLCYVGMTRAQKRLYLTWARYRRRFGGAQPEVSLPSRFLSEVPPSLREKLSSYKEPHTEEVDLFAEQHDVRESVKRNLYTGRTYNSVENIAQFFADRGMPPPSGLTRRPETAAPASSTRTEPQRQQPTRPQAPAHSQFQPRPAGPRHQTGFRAGATVRHPKYGRGTILRREGDGEDAKLTISFPGYGLKKIVEKYAGIKVDE